MNASGRARSKAKDAGRQAEQTGRQVENSKAFDALVTVGLIAYGVVHLLIAWIAVQLAWTGTGQQASQQGAFQKLADNAIGGVLVWITAIGLLALVLWQAFEALWGHRDAEQGRKRTVKRLASAAKAVVYLALGISAIATATGSSSSGNSGQQTFTARLMSVTFGQILVIAVGVIVVVVGGRLVYRGLTRKFTEDLAGGVGGRVLALGSAGYTAKGLALAIVGVLFVVAAVSYDPQKAGGLDAALRTLRQQPFGPVLLTAMAIGIACFGLYCFAWSRHVKKS